MSTSHDPNILPADLPVPQDDGAARHLEGFRLPSLALPATDGSEVDLAALSGRTVVYIYPRTGRPGQPLPDGWDAIPGARGCTPQSCSFRDHFAELKALGVSHLYGMSTQDGDYQREAAERLHLPFAILSDAGLRFTRALRLPTFAVDGMTLQKRMVLVIDDGVIAKVLYPVFPPDESAGVVVAWLRASR
jgi:peroxiredoxin